ncbi:MULTISPECIES: GNAT family N-acetyltransferase [Streptomyces]|uniref:GNAT family N-acetyltransferase n=1 Tax=Streptomyces lonegramiae TaxID=3075524 RepID=A0ABU2X9C9_9ACTN|nr:GNAT family N-acetyltransferase [Streptomyces sp. DSM 41529]MDT0542508.1 GNAT family N-acetyltransferase [Streptomyces sp. DSM 41529]
MSSTFSTSRDDLTTDRLVLQRWSIIEAAAVIDNTRSVYWADDFPADGDRVIANLFEQHPDWLGAYGHRLIIERDSGLTVGSLGLFWPPSEGILEIGYGIVASRRSRGYATEATRALAEYALTAPDVHTVTASVELSNPASLRVLEKAGFHRWATEENLARFRITSTDLR